MGRYRPAKLGVAWAVIKPLLQVEVFYLIGSILGIGGGLVYGLEIFLGVLFWQFFCEASMGGGTSILGKPNLISKVSMPSWIVPVGNMSLALINLSIAFSSFVPLYFLLSPDTASFALIPIVYGIAMFVVVSYGTGLLFSHLFVLFSDLQTLWELVLLYGAFLSPTLYPINIDPKYYTAYYSLNLIAFPLEVSKSGFYDIEPRKIGDLGWIVFHNSLILAILASGFLASKLTEKKVRDLM